MSINPMTINHLGRTIPLYLLLLAGALVAAPVAGQGAKRPTGPEHAGAVQPGGSGLPQVAGLWADSTAATGPQQKGTLVISQQGTALKMVHYLEFQRQPPFVAIPLVRFPLMLVFNN